MSTAVQPAPAQFAPTPTQLAMAYSVCSGIARTSARNFYYAFLLLPRDRRRSMCALYAFLRHTDDLADEPGPPGPKARALEDWRQALDATLAGDAGDRERAARTDAATGAAGAASAAGAGVSLAGAGGTTAAARFLDSF